MKHYAKGLIFVLGAALLAACGSVNDADGLLNPQAEDGNTVTVGFSNAPGSLDFDGQQAQERGQVTLSLDNESTRQGNRILLFGDGRLLGRTNGAGDNGFPFSSGSVGVTGKPQVNGWDFVVPFVAYRHFSQGNEFVRLATPKFNSGSVKLVHSSNFLATPGDGLDDEVSCRDGEFTAKQLENTDQGNRYGIFKGNTLLGRSNGRSDNGNLLGLVCLNVRTGDNVDGTVMNDPEIVPLVLVETNNGAIKVFTPKNSSGSPQARHRRLQTQHPEGRTSGPLQPRRPVTVTCTSERGLAPARSFV